MFQCQCSELQIIILYIVCKITPQILVGNWQAIGVLALGPHGNSTDISQATSCMPHAGGGSASPKLGDALSLWRVNLGANKGVKPMAKTTWCAGQGGTHPPFDHELHQFIELVAQMPHTSGCHTGGEQPTLYLDGTRRGTRPSWYALPGL